jgi:aryl-alcohol dehydrogenase-like predicted oxidoreductase
MLENESGTFDIGGDLTVTRLGFGAMRLTGEGIIGPPDDESEAKDVLRRAKELGIDLIDTADSYGPGVSERLIADAFGPDYEDVAVATKGGLWRTIEGDWPMCGEPDYLDNALMGSLDRLGVDSIDLYQFHRPDPDTPFGDSIERFAAFKDGGHVDHVGVSNVSVEQLEKARDTVEIATVQNEYNVGNRDSEAVLEACEEYDIGFIPWFPLGSGDLGEKSEAVSEVAEAHDATDQQVALAWLLQHSDVMLPIPGTSSADHLADNVAASQIDLSDEEMSRLTE